MLLSAVSFLVVAQSSSKVPEGLMNNPVFSGADHFDNVAWEPKRRYSFLRSYDRTSYQMSL